MNHMQSQTYPFIFFGTSRLSVIVLQELAKRGQVPVAIITTPDTRQGRKLLLTPTDTKRYGIERDIPVYTYAKLDTEAISTIAAISKKYNVEYFLVASYGLIIPQTILDIPPHGVLNIHPSLLPIYRGATPIQQAILDDVNETGVTIMKMDSKMDHGPIYAQAKRRDTTLWPIGYTALEEELAKLSVKIFTNTLEDICSNRIAPKAQDHECATFTKKITKEQGLIDMSKLSGHEGYVQYLKYLAFEVWPRTFFFVQKKDIQTRVSIKKAHWDSELSRLSIDTVIPEGQKEVPYSEFIKRISEYY